MKNDHLLSAIVSFLVPIMLLSGAFIVVSFFKEGFEMILYASVFFLAAIMIYLMGFNVKISTAINLEYIGWFLSLMAIFYLASVLLMVIFYA